MSRAYAWQLNKINSIAMDGGAILVYSRRAGTCICVALACPSMVLAWWLIG